MEASLVVAAAVPKEKASSGREAAKEAKAAEAAKRKDRVAGATVLGLLRCALVKAGHGMT